MATVTETPIFNKSRTNHWFGKLNIEVSKYNRDPWDSLGIVGLVESKKRHRDRYPSSVGIKVYLVRVSSNFNECGYNWFSVILLEPEAFRNPKNVQTATILPIPLSTT